MDRSGAYAARYVAKNVVAAGLVDRCEVQIAYAIGVAHPVSVMVDCFGTARVDQAVIERLVREQFDLRPAAIIRDLRLLAADLREDSGLRPLRSRRRRLHLGKHRQRRRAGESCRVELASTCGVARFAARREVAWRRRGLAASAR